MIFAKLNSPLVDFYRGKLLMISFILRILPYLKKPKSVKDLLIFMNAYVAIIEHQSIMKLDDKTYFFTIFLLLNISTLFLST